MKGFTKKLMAGALAASMVMGTSLVAFAAAPAGTGTSGGTGSLEGVVNTDVYTADLPTASATAYTYIVDPQGLIRKTDAAKYTGKTFGDGTVFFANDKTKGAENDYSNTSDAATIANKSSKNLSVKVTATATPDSAAGAAALATAKTFDSTNTNLEVYLGITDSVEGSTEKALTAGGVEMTAVLGAAPEGAYDYTYAADTGYSYALKSDVSSFKFAEYSFQINGAANANEKAAWKSDTALPSVNVKWDVDLTDDEATVETPKQTPAEVEPSISGATEDSDGEGWDYTANFTKGTDLVFTVDYGNKGATAISSAVVGATLENLASNSSIISVSGNTVTIAGASWGVASSGSVRYCKITLDDNTSFTVKLTIN